GLRLSGRQSPGDVGARPATGESAGSHFELLVDEWRGVTLRFYGPTIPAMSKTATPPHPSSSSATPTFRLRERLRVRWAEVDLQGIVFNGHYLTYFDIAVTEYWRAIGLPYPHAFEGTGVDLFAVKSTVEYR